jgi:membrane protease YdiL (CAAX protease family)
VADKEKAQAVLNLEGEAPPEEPAGSCRYCGAQIGPSEWGSDPGPLHCSKPECVAAYQEEMTSQARPCSSCGAPGLIPGGICGRCGKHSLKGEPLPAPDETLSMAAPEKGRWGFGQIFLLWLGLVVIEVFTASVYDGFQYGRGLPPNHLWVRATFALGESACLLFVLYLTKRLQNLTWRDSLRFLGFKGINLPQILAAVVILLPILMGKFVMIQDYAKEGGLPELSPDWKGHLASILFGAGLFEETLYRGFLFRFLRQGRSFLSAAILSAGLWAISHWTHAVPFFSATFDDPGQLGELALKIMADGILGVYLFEKGGYNIWGWMLVHVCYDCCYLVETQGCEFYVSPIPRNDWRIGEWTAVALAVPIILRFLPGKADGAGNQNPRFPAPAASRKWVVPAWGTAFLIGICFALFVVPVRNLSIQAEGKDWQNKLEARPRFADGYRQWAYELYNLYLDEEAGKRCQDALTIDPGNYKAWLIWGKSLVDQKRYSAAVEKFSKAAEFAPHNPAVFLWWGYTLERCDQKQEAVEKYRKVSLLAGDETYLYDYAGRWIDNILK